MELVNHTPFPALCFESRDKDDRAWHVVALRVTLSLGVEGPRLSRAQRPLVLADTHHGEPAASATRDESDLCPTRPGTDFFLRGTAWAPGGVEARAWEVAARVGRIHHRATVTGPRWWERARGDDWRLTEPTPCAAIPLRYELAYGGVARAEGREERCEENPVGVGFAPPWWRGGRERVEAPRIEAPDDPLRHIDRPIAVRGFGPLGRAWLPRRARAGTLDDAWLRTRWPVMPPDFDDRFWHGAPDGLVSAPHLRGDEAVTLTGVRPEGEVSFRLPGHYLFVIVRHHSGVVLPLPMWLDALTVDLDAAEVGMVYRHRSERALGVRKMELCMDFRRPAEAGRAHG